MLVDAMIYGIFSLEIRGLRSAGGAWVPATDLGNDARSSMSFC